MLARDVTSSPSSAAAESAPASASWRWRRGSACMAGREIADQPLESQPVALGPEPCHHADRNVGEHGAAPLRFAGEDVRQVHLHERPPGGGAASSGRAPDAPKNWSNEKPPVELAAGAVPLEGCGATGSAAGGGARDSSSPNT